MCQTHFFKLLVPNMLLQGQGKFPEQRTEATSLVNGSGPGNEVLNPELDSA